MNESITKHVSEDLAQDTSLEVTENLSARDVLIHFNKHIYPGIKEKFFPTPSVPVQT
jgi:hypothetical protein